MEKLLRFFPALACSWVLTVTSGAEAQSITLNQNTGVEIVREEERSTSELPLTISRKDCYDSAPNRFKEGSDDSEKEDFTWLIFYPSISGANSNHDLEVWVSQGADCKKSEERTTGGQCALVYETSRAQTLNAELVINPRDVIEREKPGNWADQVEAGKTDTCEAERNQVEANLSIWILLINGDNVDASVEWTNTELDLFAPPAPESIDVGAGDEHIFFEWEIESTLEEDDTEGFNFYCVPSGAVSTAMGGATSSGTSEGGAGGATATSCDQNILVEGEIPSEEVEKYRCGDVTGRSTRSGQADDVTNDATYAVAVSSLDAVGNSGELSSVTCITPKPVTTFYEGYKNAGGQGGGGFCQMGRLGGNALTWLVFGAGLLVLGRRRGTRA